MKQKAAKDYNWNVYDGTDYHVGSDGREVSPPPFERVTCFGGKRGGGMSDSVITWDAQQFKSLRLS